jgi:hypothetical protein
MTELAGLMNGENRRRSEGKPREIAIIENLALQSAADGLVRAVAHRGAGCE